jgi:hypothetical protein
VPTTCVQAAGNDTRPDALFIILSVKAGNLNPGYVDALWGQVERENAEIGVLLAFQEPTARMRARAAEAGFYESPPPAGGAPVFPTARDNPEVSGSE